MVKQLLLDDFRAGREVLEPEDFALSDGPEPCPSDLINQETWRHITGLQWRECLIWQMFLSWS